MEGVDCGRLDEERGRDGGEGGIETWDEGGGDLRGDGVGGNAEGGEGRVIGGGEEGEEVDVD